jgi:protein TonB
VWELLFRTRVRIAATATVAIFVGVAIVWLVWERPKDAPAPPAPDMQISLTAPAPPAPAPDEPPPPPEVKPDQFIDKQVKHRDRKPDQTPPATVPSAPDAQPSPLPPGPPAAPPGRPPKDLEEAYLAAIYQNLESIKRYPTDKEARIQQPQGTVRVRFVVARDGTLISVEIETSAGSILDHAAIATVKRGRFPPFPTEAWAGEATHSFVVPLEFKTGQ